LVYNQLLVPVTNSRILSDVDWELSAAYHYEL